MKRRSFLKGLAAAVAAATAAPAILVTKQHDLLSDLESLELPEGGRDARQMVPPEEDEVAKLIRLARGRNASNAVKQFLVNYEAINEKTRFL